MIVGYICCDLLKMSEMDGVLDNQPDRPEVGAPLLDVFKLKSRRLDLPLETMA